MSVARSRNRCSVITCNSLAVQRGFCEVHFAHFSNDEAAFPVVPDSVDPGPDLPVRSSSSLSSSSSPSASASTSSSSPTNNNSSHRQSNVGDEKKQFASSNGGAKTTVGGVRASLSLNAENSNSNNNSSSGSPSHRSSGVTIVASSASPPSSLRSLSPLSRNAATSKKRTMAFKTGYLVKQGHQRKNWLRRYFVLRGPLLAYYENEDSRKELGTVFLGGASIKHLDNYKKPNVFKIMQTTVEKDYYVQCSSEEELREWIEALQEAASPA